MYIRVHFCCILLHAYNLIVVSCATLMIEDNVLSLYYYWSQLLERPTLRDRVAFRCTTCE